MVVYLLFYLFFFPFVLFDDIKQKEHVKKIILILLGVVLSLFIGTRLVGPDLSTYKILYEMAPKLNRLTEEFAYYSWLSKFEPLFVFLYSFSNTIGLSFESFNLIYSTIFVFLFVSRIRRYTDFPFLALFIYIGFAYMSGWSALRQFMAASIFFFSIAFLLEGKKLKYTLMIGLSMFFHYSAIVLIPLIFVPKIKLMSYWYFGLMFFFLALYFSGVVSSITSTLLSFLPFLHEDKIHGNMLEGGSLISSVFILWTVLNIFCITFYSHVKNKVNNFEYYFNLLFSCYLAYILLVGLGSFGRVIMYYKIVFPVFLTLFAITFVKKQRVILALGLAGISIYIYYKTIVGMDELAGPANDRFIPYRSWLLE